MPPLIPFTLSYLHARARVCLALVTLQRGRGERVGGGGCTLACGRWGKGGGGIELHEKSVAMLLQNVTDSVTAMPAEQHCDGFTNPSPAPLRS